MTGPALELIDADHHLHGFSGAPDAYPGWCGPVRKTSYGIDEKPRYD